MKFFYNRIAQWREHIKSGFLMPIFAILAIGVLFLSIQQYTTSFRATFAEETQAYMVEIAQQVTLVMNDRVEANLKNIQTDAMALAKMGLEDDDDIIAFLDEEAQRYGCSVLSLADTEGIAITNQGSRVNVALRKHYLTARQGDSAISGLVTSGYYNTDCIEYAVPVTEGEIITGVLIATYNLDDFQDILQVNIFEGQGIATVIDQQGIVIISSNQQASYNFNYALKDNPSVSAEDFLRFTDDLAKSNSGVLNYSVEDVALMMHYQPLGINDWTLLITAPAEQMTSKTNVFLRGTVYIGLAITILVTVLMVLVVIIQHRSRKALEYVAYVDPVTQGNSFAKFEVEAKKMIAQHDPGYYALLQLNLEKFKLINTTFGREQGNRLLCYIYQTICGALYPDELVARVSADRFCLLVHLETPEEMAQRLTSFSELINQFNNGRSSTYRLRFNVGVCIVDSVKAEIDMLYERANFARLHGVTVFNQHDRIAFFNEIERELLVREKEIENRMEEALQQGEFEIYLQPKYALTTNTCSGAEALVRWRDPQIGLVSPADFIPLFERNGFIVNIDLYVFEQVCDLQQQLWDNGITDVPISVNLSRKHLEDLDFLFSYKLIFDRYTFPAKLIELELTESILFDNMQQLCTVIDDIHHIGFECAMDDFGSGYSSLNLLKDIPVDSLKLDRAFFRGNINEDVKSRYVIEAVLDLANKLNMKTVSEGVETLEQVDYLREMNCGMVQGYVFAKPMPVDQFIKLLSNAEGGNNEEH